MINFFEEKKVDMISGKLYYFKKEYSFIFRSENTDRTTKLLENYATILINTLQLHINLPEKNLMFIFGFCPNTHWINNSLDIPIFKQSGVIFESNLDLKHSEVFELSNLQSLPTYFDPINGWICIGNKSIKANATAIEFATHTAISLLEGKIDSIWLHPIFSEVLP